MQLRGRLPVQGPSAAPGRVSIWTVPPAGHIQGHARDPVEWEQTVVGFLDTALGVDEGG